MQIGNKIPYKSNISLFFLKSDVVHFVPFLNEMKERGFRLGYRLEENYVFLKIGDPKLDDIELKLNSVL